MKQAIIYARVSTTDQADKGFSLPSQIEECRKYALRIGYQIIAEFCDDYSGATPIEMRPEGRTAYATLRDGGADALISLAVDRIVRPPEEGDEWEMPTLIRGLAKLGKEIHTVEDGQLKTDFASLLIAMFKAKSAGDERRKITERTQRGKRAKAKNGNVTGGAVAPYGYQHVRDEKGRITTFEIVESEARIIRMIFDWYVREKYSAGKIAIELSKIRVQTPGETRRGYHRKRGSGFWASAQVLQIIGQEAYGGTWRYNQRDRKTRQLRDASEHYTIAVPSIVERNVWELAQEQRKTNKDRSPRNRKREYLLGSLVKCTCGRARIGCAMLNKYRYYECSQRTSLHMGLEPKICHERFVRADVLETHIWADLVEFFENLPELKRLLQLAQAEEDDQQSPVRDELATVEEFMKECDQEASDCAASMRRATGRVLAKMEQQQVEINSRYDDLQKRHTDILAKLAHQSFTDQDITDILNFAADVRAGMENPDYATMRRNLENLNVQVTAISGHYFVKCVLGEWEGTLPAPGTRIPKNSSSIVVQQARGQT